MLILEDLEKEERGPITAEFGSSKIVFKYHPNRFTPELEETMRSLRDGDADEDILNTPTVKFMIEKLVASWDVKLRKTDKGFAPVEEAVIRRIPKALLYAMLAAVSEDLNPNPETAPNSTTT